MKETDFALVVWEHNISGNEHDAKTIYRRVTGDLFTPFFYTDGKCAWDAFEHVHPGCKQVKKTLKSIGQKYAMKKKTWLTIEEVFLIAL